jgi:hypothetical protein
MPTIDYAISDTIRLKRDYSMEEGLTTEDRASLRVYILMLAHPLGYVGKTSVLYFVVLIYR